MATNRLDRSMIDQLRELQSPGGPDVLAEIVGLYLSGAPALLRKIVDAAASHPDGPATAETLKPLRLAAHTLKSSSANLGAESLARILGDIEKAARDAGPGALAGIRRLIPQAQADYAVVVTELSEMLSAPRT